MLWIKISILKTQCFRLEKPEFQYIENQKFAGAGGQANRLVVVRGPGG